MPKFNRLSIAVLIPCALLFAACSQGPKPTPTIDANAILTQAAGTVSAQLTQNPPATQPPAPTNPPLPTDTPAAPLATAAQPAVPPAGATNSPVPPTQPPASSQDAGSFVADVTIPDGTGAAPGVQFTKTWRIKNTGVSTWTANYSLVPVDGDRMGSPDSIPMPTEVRPGETVDITVKLTAPAKDGSYKTYFRLRNAGGQYFRLDGSGDLWVYIVVGGVTATPDMTQTAKAPTATPTGSPTP